MIKILPGGFFELYQTSYQGRIREFELRLESEYDLEKRKSLVNDTLNELHANVHCFMFRLQYINFESDKPMNFSESLQKMGYPPNYYEAQKKVDKIEGYHDEELCNFIDKCNELLERCKENDETLEEAEFKELMASAQNYEQLLELFDNKLLATEQVKEKIRLLGVYQEEDDDYISYNGVVAWFYFEKEFYNYVLKRYNELKDSKTASLSSQPTQVNEVPHIKRKILFLTANPIIINAENKQTPLLRVAEECRKVKDSLNAATNRKDFEFISEPAVRINTITKAMQVHKPQIVHFSGHGTKTKGIAIENESGQVTLFPIEGLERLFKLFDDTVKCVVLNACHSSTQAEVISKHGIYVVGMNDAIGDKAATSFAVGFYQSLGEGNDYEFAFGIGMVNVSPHLKYANKPELWFNGKRIRN